MSVPSVTEQTSTYIGRRVAEARVRGVPSPDVEARAVFDLIGLNLLLYPRSVLFLIHLARNGLVKAVQDEIDCIDEVKESAADLGNATLSVRTTRRLERARTALVQFGTVEKIDPTSGTFLRFDNAVSEFLDKDLGRTLRRPGSSKLTRPANEAATDLAAAFASLVELHADTLDRLYALPVGAENFFGAPIRGLVGLVTADRVRRDIEALISAVEGDGFLEATREIAVKLITGRAALRTVSSPPAYDDPVLSTAAELPAGYVVTGESDPAAVLIESADGPFTLGAGAQLEVSDGTTSLGPFYFPQDGFDLADRAWVVGDETSFPVVVPAGAHLFLDLAGTQVKIPITSGSRSLAQIIADINAAAAGVTAVEFAGAGSSRLAVIAGAAAEISVLGTYLDTTTGGIWTESIHELVGLDLGQSGESGTVSPVLLVDAFNHLFGSIAKASLDDSAILIEGVSNEPGARLVVAGPAALGIDGTHYATSDTFRLLGTVSGVTTDPVDATSFLAPGDVVTTPGAEGIIRSVNAERVVLTAAIRTFSGPISVESPIVAAYEALVSSISKFLATWRETPYTADLKRIDRVVAATLASRSPAQRGELEAELDTLRSLLEDLKTILTSATTAVPVTSVPVEREVISGILSTLRERKYDRAQSLLLRGQILETLLLDDASASFGGYAQKTISEFVRNDVRFPDRSQDEGFETRTAERSS